MRTQVQVELQTQRAKQQLKDLERTGGRTAGRLSKRVRQTVGTGLTAATGGIGLGLGLQSVRAATSSGAGDVFGEAFGLIGQQISSAVFGELGPRARAASTARDRLIENFGLATFRNGGQVPQGGLDFFENVRSLEFERASGAKIINDDPRFRGVTIEDIFTRLKDVLVEALKTGAQELADRLNPF